MLYKHVEFHTINGALLAISMHLTQYNHRQVFLVHLDFRYFVAFPVRGGSVSCVPRLQIFCSLSS